MYQGYEAFTNENLAKFILILIGYAIILDIYLYRGLSVLFNFIKNKKLKKPGNYLSLELFCILHYCCGHLFWQGRGFARKPGEKPIHLFSEYGIFPFVCSLNLFLLFHWLCAMF
jgi:hypothetical protein